jgi:ribonuclease P protein component
MLPSHQRLSRQQITDLLANKGIKVVFNRLGTLKFITNSTGLTVVTGSKQQKKAVLRNTLRRRIYTLFSNYKGMYAITAILYVSKQSYEMSYDELKQYLYDLLQKTST